jgi:hypothetical protein
MREFLWGQAFGPAAGLPPGAGKRKIFGQRCEPRLDRIPFDVVLHARRFLVVADQVVVAFVLPERAFVQSEHADGFVSGEAFQRAEPFSGRHARRHEQVHVIRHDHESVQFVALESSLAVLEGTNHHFGYFRLLKKHWAAIGMIEQPIHSYERLSSRQVGRPEDAAGRKASVQTEGYEYSFAHDIKVRKAAFVPAHFGSSSGGGWFVSESFEEVCAGRKPGGRAEAPPHRLVEVGGLVEVGWVGES